MRVAYEALAWGRHVSEYDHAWRIVRAADHPALGICLDSFHILSRADEPRERSPTSPPTSCSSSNSRTRPTWSWTSCSGAGITARFPGQGGFDLADFTAPGARRRLRRAAVARGVQRRVSPGRSRAHGDRRHAVAADPGGIAQRRRLAASAPAGRSLRGYAFVELAVEPTSVGETQRLLHALGFAPGGAAPDQAGHAVAAGETCRVLLNAGAPTAPGIAAIAVESADPGRSARAGGGAAGARCSRRQRGPRRGRPLGRSPRPTGPRCSSAAATSAREAERLARGLRGAGSDREPASAGLDRIDHVALAQPFDYFDEAALFYRSVLGLEPLESLELAAPNGLVRSRAVTSADGTVRLALNVPLLAHDTAPAGGPAARRVRLRRHLRRRRSGCGTGASGRSRSRGNYYDDLAARLDLDPSLIGAMRELGVLYDRDPGGEFLHFYTPTIGGRLFFEVVERRGGYDGYGGRERAGPHGGAATGRGRRGRRLDARSHQTREGERGNRSRHPGSLGSGDGRKTPKKAARSRAGSAACSSTTTSSSTGPPPRWSSARCSSRPRSRPPARFCRLRPTGWPMSRGRWARSSWAISATGTAASESWS